MQSTVIQLCHSIGIYRTKFSRNKQTNQAIINGNKRHVIPCVFNWCTFLPHQIVPTIHKKCWCNNNCCKLIKETNVVIHAYICLYTFLLIHVVTPN